MFKNSLCWYYTSFISPSGQIGRLTHFLRQFTIRLVALFSILMLLTAVGQFTTGIEQIAQIDPTGYLTLNALNDMAGPGLIFAGVVSALILLLTIWGSLVTFAKRFHDLGASGWWILIPILTPFAIYGSTFLGGMIGSPLAVLIVLIDLFFVLTLFFVPGVKN